MVYVVSQEEFEKRLPFASGQTVVCNDYLKNIRFINGRCEVMLGGANITNAISDVVAASGVSLPHQGKGCTYVQAIAEAIDFLVGENPSKERIHLASGSSGEYAYLSHDGLNGKVFYSSPRRQYVAAEFVVIAGIEALRKANKPIPKHLR